LTACGGGVVRDVLVCEIPSVLVSDFYATASLIGGAFFVLLRPAGFDLDMRITVAIVITIIFRLIAMRYRISLPHAKRLPMSPSEMTKQRKVDRNINNQ